MSHPVLGEMEDGVREAAATGALDSCLLLASEFAGMSG